MCAVVVAPVSILSLTSVWNSCPDRAGWAWSPEQGSRRGEGVLTAADRCCGLRRVSLPAQELSGTVLYSLLT